MRDCSSAAWAVARAGGRAFDVVLGEAVLLISSQSKYIEGAPQVEGPSLATMKGLTIRKQSGFFNAENSASNVNKTRASWALAD